MDEVQKTIPTRIKEFVGRHKVAIAVIGTAGICLKLNRFALKGHDDFLKEKGLFDEFYTPEDDE